VTEIEQGFDVRGAGWLQNPKGIPQQSPGLRWWPSTRTYALISWNVVFMPRDFGVRPTGRDADSLDQFLARSVRVQPAAGECNPQSYCKSKAR